MSNPEISVEDAELAALMDELERENASFPVTAAVPAKAAEPVVEAAAEPEPEPEPEPIPEPVAEKLPEPAPAEKPKAAKAKPVAVAEPAPEIDMAQPAEDNFGKADVPESSAAAKLKYSIDVVEFNKETKLTEATLDNCMIEQSGLRAFYGAQAANAEAQHARLKARFEVLEARLYDESRKSLAASGEKTTEKMVENAVKLHPKWLQAKNAVIEADTIASINKSLVASLADRRDMMIQLGADRREEYKGAARVLAEKDNISSLKDRASRAAVGNIQ